MADKGDLLLGAVVAEADGFHGLLPDDLRRGKRGDHVAGFFIHFRAHQTRDGQRHHNKVGGQVPGLPGPEARELVWKAQTAPGKSPDEVREMVPDAFAGALLQHCYNEFTFLSRFLPSLYVAENRESLFASN